MITGLGDPVAPWLHDIDMDSGTDDKMVNVPVYFNNSGSSITSEELEYQNWLDLHFPGHEDEFAEPEPGSVTGSEEWNDWSEESDPSDLFHPVSSPYLSPPVELIPTSGEGTVGQQTRTNSPLGTPVTPVQLHLQGCLCNGCIRYSPKDENRSLGFSFPVNMQEVCIKLQAHVEWVNLSVDISIVHWEANAEEQELIDEFLTNGQNTPHNQATFDVEDREVLAWNLASEYPEAGQILREEEKEEQELVEWQFRLKKWFDTLAMVRYNTVTFRQIQWERRQLENCPFPGDLQPNSVEMLISQQKEIEVSNQNNQNIIGNQGGMTCLAINRRTHPSI